MNRFVALLLASVIWHATREQTFRVNTLPSTDSQLTFPLLSALLHSFRLPWQHARCHAWSTILRKSLMTTDLLQGPHQKKGRQEQATAARAQAHVKSAQRCAHGPRAGGKKDITGTPPNRAAQDSFTREVWAAVRSFECLRRQVTTDDVGAQRCHHTWDQTICTL